MSDWNNFKKIKSSGGDILKPDKDKPYKIRVVGEPWVYNTEYQGNVSTRFAVTIYNQTENAAQILMLSKTAFGLLFDLHEDPEWGDLSTYDVTMKKTGEGTETKYSFIPSAKKALDEDKKSEVESILLEDVLSRLPSVQLAIPLSEFDPEQLVSKPKEINIEDIEGSPDEIPFD